MRRGLGDAIVAAAVLLLVGIGAFVETFAPQVDLSTETRPTRERFVERAVFCPPSVRGSRTTVVASDQEPRGVTIGIEPTRSEEVSLPAGDVIVQPLEDAPADVVGFGDKVAASAIVRAREPVEGEAAALCAPATSARWIFAAGASTLGSDERFLIYNPFPHEAVVRITLLGTNGPLPRGGLSDVAVPADGATVVRVNDYVRLERALGAIVESKRGRVVAWRLMFDSAEGGPGGMTLSLGAVSGHPTWYFPDASLANGTQMHLAIANPTEEDASVTVSLPTGEEVLQPESLVEMPVPAMSVRYFPVAPELPGNVRADGVSAVVQSTNDVAVVSELVMRYSSGDVVGTGSEVGVSQLGRRWYLPPATLEPATDTVVVMNPGSQATTISMTLMDSAGGPQSPAELADLRIAPGGRLKVGLGDWANGRPAVVILQATQPVVAQRFSYSSAFDDVGAVMGLRLLGS